jgi:raffinose/stachyose/melibiose transport system substrate-binding protein
MSDLPNAQNQRFASPQVAAELDNVLAGVAGGTVTPQEALQRVQAVTDKELGKK